MRLKDTTLALLFGAAAAAGADEGGERPALEPALNAEAGSPLGVSANLGIRVPLGASGYGRGLLLQAQPGVGGVGVNVGFVPVSFYGQGMQLIAFGAKARLLRTWGSGSGTKRGRTYAGFEVGAALGVKLAVGLLWKVDSGPRHRMLTWSVGLGF